MKKLFLLVTSFFCAYMAIGQYSIDGMLFGPDNEPVIGGVVLIEGTEIGAASDVSGHYQIDNLAPGKYNLKVSYIGYKAFAKEVTVVNKNITQDLKFFEKTVVSICRTPIEVFVSPTHAGSFTDLDQKDLEEQNFGQDLPYMLRLTPSAVSTSDAGAGVGYTGMRIRGSDATRINVTINGIPFNDSESHGLFWVNMPDFASSADKIQIQRGIGSSSNGVGAFGATIGISTKKESELPFVTAEGVVGSFGTLKSNISFGSGIINNHWVIEGRRSNIVSDGFVDRSSSELKSNYLSATYFNKNYSIQGVMINGKERTYQSWWGVPEAKLFGDSTALATHISNNGYDSLETANLLDSDPRTYNYYTYENEVDNYNQDHYQLHFNSSRDDLYFSAALHYTYGRGYFEQFKKGEDFVDYGLNPVTLPNDTLYTTDLIQRRWLDNDFYGLTFNLSKQDDNRILTLGGAANEYAGDHFGRLIWSQFASNSTHDTEYYASIGNKRDANIYAKYANRFGQKLNLTLDLQYRFIDYIGSGLDSDRTPFKFEQTYGFFNPKILATYRYTPQFRIYLNAGISNKEPVRSDFIDADAGEIPEHETLLDVETGIVWERQRFSTSLNLFAMEYQNQLVLTGEINDVGASVRTNVDRSYRRGIEFLFGMDITNRLNWEANIALSANKIEKFDDIIFDYAIDDVIVTPMENTDISFSPSVISASVLSYDISEKMKLSLFSKYVGKQYMDNTSNENRKLDPYFVNDITFDYYLGYVAGASFKLGFQINNILSEEYESNGYTYSYAYGDVITENFYFPQAGRNFMLRLKMSIHTPKPHVVEIL